MIRSPARRIRWIVAWLLPTVVVSVGTARSISARASNEADPASPSLSYYGENTPEVTRQAHREAVASLRSADWTGACDAVGVLSTSERRRLTHYLELLCTVHQPEWALTADRIDFALSGVSEPPGLRELEARTANRYFAWIAAVQDVLADGVERRGFGRPLPPHLRGSLDTLSVVAWKERGARYDKATYDATRRSLEDTMETLEGHLAESELFANLTRWNADSMLSADLSAFPLPDLPEMSLPAAEDL